MRAIEKWLMCGMLLGMHDGASPAPLQRQLKLNVSVDATQAWKNELQWSKASSQQRYELTTQLHSDGRLYAQNLLDPDLDKRSRIKSEFYTYQGLLELKRENGGRLPSGNALMPEISAESLKAGGSCLPGVDCPSASPQRFSAIAALQDNTPAQIEQFMKSFEAPGGKWLYFTGFAGCRNQLRLNYTAHFAGEQAFDHARKKLQPFEMDWVANTEGSAEEKASLCRRYTITLDTGSGTMYVENAYLPSPRGTSTRKTGRGLDRRESDLPPPYELMRWVGDTLSKNRPSGSQEAVLKLTQPLDGNSTVLGLFDGTAKVRLSWSFAEPAQR